jgi:hypothetical protein
MSEGGFISTYVTPGGGIGLKGEIPQRALMYSPEELVQKMRQEIIYRVADMVMERLAPRLERVLDEVLKDEETEVL